MSCYLREKDANTSRSSGLNVMEIELIVYENYF